MRASWWINNIANWVNSATNDTRKMKFSSSDGRDDGEQDDVDFVVTSRVFLTQDAFDTETEPFGIFYQSRRSCWIQCLEYPFYSENQRCISGVESETNAETTNSRWMIWLRHYRVEMPVVISSGTDLEHLPDAQNDILQMNMNAIIEETRV